MKVDEGEGYASYDAADEDADQAMRLQIKEASRSDFYRRKQLAEDALSTLSSNAQRALGATAHLAAAATVEELAKALEDGKFDHGHLKAAGLKSKQDIIAFVEQRLAGAR